MKRIFLFLSAFMFALLGEAVRAEAIWSETDLTAAIAGLERPEKRFQSFLDLVDFASDRTAGDHRDEAQLGLMHAKAVKALNACPYTDAILATFRQHLAEPNHRLDMLLHLLKLGGWRRLYSTSEVISPIANLEALGDHARQAAGGAADAQTVTKALTNTSPILRFWAVQQFGNSLSATNDWLQLLPQIERIASEGSRDERSAALTSLMRFPGTLEFLNGRLAHEKSAFLLADLLHGRELWGREFDARFWPRLERLLTDPDEEVRVEALDFVGCNSPCPANSKVVFTRSVFDLVINLTQSPLDKERFEAVYALNCIQEIDRGASRGAFLRLVHDPDEDLRSRLAACFDGQYDRDDVKQAIATLLRDKSPWVEYMTILAIGPEKHLPELLDLSRSKDTKTAQSAAGAVKGVLYRMRQAPSGLKL